MSRHDARRFRVARLNSRWRRLWPAPAVLLGACLGTAWPAETRPKVAVLEFRVGVGNAPAGLGSVAAWVISDALAATGRYAMIPQDRVQEVAHKAGLQPPFGVGHIELLADVLGADIVVHGSIRGLTFNSAAGAASVMVAAEVVDGKSGNLRQRAEATGTRSAAVAVAHDQGGVVVEALAIAAGKLAEAITGVKVQTALPTGGASAAAVAVGATASLPPALLPVAASGTAEQPATSTPRLDLFPKVPIAEYPAIPGAAAGGSNPATTTQSPVPPADNEGNQPPAGSSEARGPDEMPGEPLVQATVLAKLGPNGVLITLGRDALVAPKMIMDVYRISYSHGEGGPVRQRIGRIRVAKINATDAEARIIEGAALIRTGDMAYNFGQ